MVQFSEGTAIATAMVPTIWKHDNSKFDYSRGSKTEGILILDGRTISLLFRPWLEYQTLVHYSGHGLNNEPFNDPTVLNHLNTELVRYSDPHCITIQWGSESRPFENRTWSDLELVSTKIIYHDLDA